MENIILLCFVSHFLTSHKDVSQDFSKDLLKYNVKKELYFMTKILLDEEKLLIYYCILIFIVCKM